MCLFVPGVYVIKIIIIIRIIIYRQIMHTTERIYERYKTPNEEQMSNKLIKTQIPNFGGVSTVKYLMPMYF